MRFVFVKKRLEMPRRSGHDVHTYELMRALQRLGHEVSFVTLQPSDPDAAGGITLRVSGLLSAMDVRQVDVSMSWLQAKFTGYWGMSVEPISQLAGLVERLDADVTVASGLDVLPLLAGVRQGTRVWYAGDEWVRHHLSLVRVAEPATWGHVRTAAIKGVYERAFAPVIDRAWVVTPAEAVAMRRYAGVSAVDVVPNGIDGAHFAPPTVPVAERPHSACFWGRLDFEPNIQALQWFCGKVWPLVRGQVPDASFQIYGFQPGPEVRALESAPGVTLTPDLPDLRGAVAGHEVVVLPFVSGGGIKNKLLEAAAMGRPVMVSSVAMDGLAADAPFVRAGSADEWVKGLVELWASPSRRREVGERAREWVLEHHTWQAAAQRVLDGLREAGQRTTQ